MYVWIKDGKFVAALTDIILRVEIGQIRVHGAVGRLVTQLWYYSELKFDWSGYMALLVGWSTQLWYYSELKSDRSGYMVLLLVGWSAGLSSPQSAFKDDRSRPSTDSIPEVIFIGIIVTIPAHIFYSLVSPHVTCPFFSFLLCYGTSDHY